MRAQRGSMGIKLRSMIEHSEVGVKTVFNCDNCAIIGRKEQRFILTMYTDRYEAISTRNFTKHRLINTNYIAKTLTRERDNFLRYVSIDTVRSTSPNSRNIRRLINTIIRKRRNVGARRKNDEIVDKHEVPLYYFSLLILETKERRERGGLRASEQASNEESMTHENAASFAPPPSGTCFSSFLLQFSARVATFISVSRLIYARARRRRR